MVQLYGSRPPLRDPSLSLELESVGTPSNKPSDFESRFPSHISISEETSIYESPSSIASTVPEGANEQTPEFESVEIPKGWREGHRMDGRSHQDIP